MRVLGKVATKTDLVADARLAYPTNDVGIISNQVIVGNGSWIEGGEVFATDEVLQLQQVELAVRNGYLRIGTAAYVVAPNNTNIRYVECIVPLAVNVIPPAIGSVAADDKTDQIVAVERLHCINDVLDRRLESRLADGALKRFIL